MSAKLYSWRSKEKPVSEDTPNKNLQPQHGSVQESKVKLDSYEELYNCYKTVIIKSLMRRGVSHDEAEEITHEAFVRLLRLNKRRVPDYLKSYLYKIATNLAIDVMRRKGCSPIVTSEQEFEEICSWESLPSSPEETMRLCQTIDEINDALKELPDKCQIAFTLYKVKGLEYKEIAAHLNISESMVRKYVLRAIRHCYDRLYDQ